MKQLIPAGLTKEQTIKYIIDNKDALIAQKKMTTKHTDTVGLSGLFVNQNGDVVKSDATDCEDGILRNSTVMNSSYWFDSHGDVHIDKCWKKTLKETTLVYLLQEHRLQFDKIITDNVKAYTKMIAWKTLGVNIDGETECLVFDNAIELTTTNAMMYDLYKRGKVKQHSVGMRYIDIRLAVNTQDKDMKEYKKEWDKHIDKIANKTEVENNGYFWAVYECKLIEGSAVPLGSNPITPTLDNTSKNTLNEPSADTHTEPLSNKIQTQLQLLKLKSF